MKIDIITLFPDMFRGPFDMSMLKKAQDKGLTQITIHDLRQFGLGPRRTVDDTPYGGGDGMLLRVEPVAAAIAATKVDNPSAMVIFVTPVGHQFKQTKAEQLAVCPGLIIVCGHYEGFDARLYSLADERLSIGDYVLTGGELAAMAITDAVVRLIPGVLNGEASAAEESFGEMGLLEHPHYTRPDEWQGLRVPEVLKNGHHAEIAAWRKQKSLEATQVFRPDLLS